MTRLRLIVGAALLSAALVRAATPEYGYKVIHVYPHDRSAFTEGLEYRAGYLYESTGREGQSVLRKVQLETGAVLQQIKLAPQLFGEGITVLDSKIVQLTYKTNLGFIYDQGGFKQQRVFSYPGEGWSLTNDGRQIFMDDGTSEIRIWDAVTLRELKRIKVHDGVKAIDNVNEMEFVGGEIYANIWMTDRVARISPVDGRVLGWVDLSGLLTEAEREQTDVLNGIAYDALGGRLFVTGKLWPKLFEIQLVPKTPAPKKSK
jgi:glutaminyl-peptide cyclotransferase